MRNPLRQIARVLPLAIAVTFVAPLAVPSPVEAQSVDQQRRKVEAIVDELERLEEKAFQLGEQYSEALETQAQLDLEIADAETRLAQKEAELDELRASLSEMARRSFVGSGATPLGPLFEDSDNFNDSLRRDELARVALSAGDVSSDELDALVGEINNDRDTLGRKRRQAEELADSIAAAQDQTERSTAEYVQAKAEAEATLGRLVREEEERRARESARQLAAQAAAQNQANQNRPQAAPGQGNSNANTGGSANSGGNANTGGSANAGGNANSSAPSTGGATASAPNVSSRSGIAVSAALAQQGVPYRYATSSPGVSFDCSGLTKYAWGQAGVALPHQSRAQYASLPHVSKDQAQPGDLLFFYSPISHVSIYLGNNQQVHAPATGKTVTIATVNWGKVVGVGRPG